MWKYLNHKNYHNIKMWVDTEQNLQNTIWQSQNHDQKECSYDTLQQERTTVCRNTCNEWLCRTKSCISEGWNVAPKAWSTSQHNPAANNICKQESNQCRNLVGQNKQETLGKLYNLEILDYYWFDAEVSITTDHKLLLAILRKIWQAFTQVAKNIVMHPLIKHKNILQTRTTILHSRLAVQI